MYDSKFLKHPDKIKMHWLGPYVVMHITKAGAIKLHKLDGTLVVGMINGNWLKPYHDEGSSAPPKKIDISESWQKVTEQEDNLHELAVDTSRGNSKRDLALLNESRSIKATTLTIRIAIF